MQLETQALGVLVSSCCCSTYRVADHFSSLGTFSSSSIGGSVFHPIAECEHPPMCLPGTGIASQETAISGSFQQNLATVCTGVSVWKLIMGWIPRYGSLYMVHPLFSAPNFVSVTHSMGVLFPILRSGKVSTLWSSFFLNFMRLASCILYLGYPKFLGYYPLIREYILCEFLCDWFTSLRMIPSRSIHLPRNFINSFFLIAE